MNTCNTRSAKNSILWFFDLVIVMHLEVIFLKKDFIVKNIKKTYEEPVELLENSTIPFVFLIFLVL